MRIPLSRRVQVIGVAVAVVVVLAAGLTVALAGGGDPPVVRLSAPRYVADPVPKPKKIGHLPAHCGVRKATVHRFVPGRDKNQGDASWCAWEWYSTKTVGAENRELQAGLGADGPDVPTTGKSADGDALRLMNPADPQQVAAGRAVRPVSGLGEEALYAYTPATQGDHLLGIDDPGAVLRFRVGANVISITATGRDRAKDQSLHAVPEKQMRPVVFAAAADVARALHVPAKPVFTAGTAGPPPPIAHPVRPCDLVPDELAHRLVPGAVGARPEDVGLPGDAILSEPGAVVPSYGEAVDSCDWEVGDDYSAKHDHLSVTVLTETNWRPGIAVPQATRQYLVLHDEARAKEAPYFHAVRGLGDQAFTGHGSGEDTVDWQDDTFQVTFRRRNLVVVVGYDGTGLTDGQDINGAYTVAARAQEALR